ncbi:hypothetical protein ACIPJ2_03125 [Curtobacterium sp. NPDC090217]|uniref:hypothetical protein n=1 Tax=Curtobacterium sp. NPDC090217 TaxID=3363970 RepID=UPI0038297941
MSDLNSTARRRTGAVVESNNQVVAPREARYLSCYTAAIACALGLIKGPRKDWRVAVGEKVGLQVRFENDLIVFRHHRTSLRSLFPETPRRQGTDSFAEARQYFADLVQAGGCVIVVGDAGRLPWSVRRGRESAPHWFVIDGVRAGEWHVVDWFSSVDEHGEQSPWSGWVAADAEIAMAPQLDRVQVLRERYAWSDPDGDPDLDGVSGHVHQFFGLRLPASTHGPSPQSAYTGPVATDRGAHAWQSGAEAVAALAARFDELCTAGDFTEADDIWVAARHRSLKSSALDLVPGVTGQRRTAADSAARAWADLPKIIRYAELSARRGRVRVGPLREAFGRVVEAEYAEEALLMNRSQPVNNLLINGGTRDSDS